MSRSASSATDAIAVAVGLGARSTCGERRCSSREPRIDVVAHAENFEACDVDFSKVLYTSPSGDQGRWPSTRSTSAFRTVPT